MINNDVLWVGEVDNIFHFNLWMDKYESMDEWEIIGYKVKLGYCKIRSDLKVTI